MGFDRSRLVLKYFFKLPEAHNDILLCLHSSVNVFFKCMSVINDDCQDKKRGNRPLVALLGDLIGQPGDMIDHLIDHMRHIFHHMRQIFVSLGFLKHLVFGELQTSFAFCVFVFMQYALYF